MKTAATLACLVAACVSHAADLPTASTLNAIAYATEQEAAQAALTTAVEQDQALEQAGGIALLDGKYYPTNAVSNNDAGHFAIKIQFAGKLVAIYHTHPGTDGTADSFSKDDRQVAAQMHVHSYIKAVASNGVYLLADGRVSQVGGHSLCHQMECKDYYAALRHRAMVLTGMER
jgi:hypothetical protein